MPLYEYECKTCHGRFERIVKFSDPPETHCPKCGGEVEQLISAPAVQFKGSGFYVNDYARKSSGGASAESKGGDSGGGSSEKSGDGGATSSSAEKSAPASSGSESKPAASSSSDKKD
jgi:putative FmdB family regulatory protein